MNECMHNLNYRMNVFNALIVCLHELYTLIECLHELYTLVVCLHELNHYYQNENERMKE